MENLLNKGDVVKTSLTDSTLVLKVEGDKALLFTGNQFVVAHGVQKENDHVFWLQGDYYDELPNNIFERDVQKEIPKQHQEQGKNFSYEKFCEYVRNRMSMIYKDHRGQYEILEDTQPLQEFGLITEEETLRHIYDNNLFGKMEEIIDKNSLYISDSKLFEGISETIKKLSSSELETNLEDEEDWELEP